MSKRKNRNQSPNIPQSTLDRARQQLGPVADEPVEAAPEVKEVPVRTVERVEPVITARAAADRRPRTVRTPRKEEKHDMAYVRARLENPTRIVTEAQLKEEYSYVVKDLRWMGGLAAILVVALIVIQQIT